LRQARALSFTPAVRFLVAPIVAAVLVAGCAPTSDPIVDGWSIGEPTECLDTAERCEAEVRAALEALDARDPGHAQVTLWQRRLEGASYDATTGDRVLQTRSGSCCTIVLIHLADGRSAAIGVAYPGISKVAVALRWGPHVPEAAAEPS
jgi:hypothetical protein